MQPHEPGEKLRFSGRHLPQILARIRIEHPLPATFRAGHDDDDGAIRVWDRHRCDFEAGIRLLDGCAQLLGRHEGTRGGDRRQVPEKLRNFATIDDGTAADADDKDVDADANAGPQVNLKQGPPGPDALRLSKESLTKRHVLCDRLWGGECGLD